MYILVSNKNVPFITEKAMMSTNKQIWTPMYKLTCLESARPYQMKDLRFLIQNGHSLYLVSRRKAAEEKANMHLESTYMYIDVYANSTVWYGGRSEVI
jgi:hypothetical protein